MRSSPQCLKPQSPWPAILAITLGPILHLFRNGYAFGGCSQGLMTLSASSDHANVLPWVHRAADPTLYPHDLSVTTGAGYATILWRSCGWLSHLVPVEWLFLGLYLLALVATHRVLFLLGRDWCGGDRPSRSDRAGLSASLLFTMVWSSPAGVDTFDPALYTRVAALPLALEALRRLTGSRPGQGFIWLVVALTIHSLTAFYAGAFAAAVWVIERRWRRLAGLGGLGLVVAGWAAGTGRLSSTPPTVDWLELQRSNNAMHLFPTTWGWGVWLDLGICGLFVLLALFATGRRRRLALAVLVASVGLGLLGFAAAMWPKSTILLQLQPLRGLGLTMILALVFAAGWAVTATTRRLHQVLSFAALAALFLGVPHLPSPIARNSDGWHYQRPMDLPFRNNRNPWVDVQQWIEGNLSTDAHLLTPPDLEGFRTYSRRSHFVDWKQGTLSLFHPEFGEQWQQRMRWLVPRRLDVHPFRNLIRNYDALTPDELSNLARRYGLSHAIVRKPKSLPFPELYANSAFRVYQLPPAPRTRSSR